MLRHVWKGGVILGVLMATGAGARALTFGDVNIEYWTGDGEHEAVMLVDWKALTGTGLYSKAFGYRWDGPAPTLFEMMEAIVANSEGRLHREWHPLWGEAAIYAWGWDVDNDGDIDQLLALPPPDPVDWYEKEFGLDPYNPDLWWGHWYSDDTMPDPGLDWDKQGQTPHGLTLYDGYWDGWSWPESYQPIPPTVPIPEPITLVLFGLGGVAVAQKLRRRRA